MKEQKVIFLRGTSIKNDSRTLKETSGLIEAGFGVKVFGWDKDGFLGENKEIIFDNINIPVEVCKIKAAYGNGMKNIFKLIYFQFWLMFKLIKERKNIDIIHSCDLDTAIPAYVISKIFKKKMVYDIFDYYIQSHKVPKKIKNIVEKIEIAIINNADLTIICTEERIKQIEKSVPKKYIVIHNTPNIPDIKKENNEIEKNNKDNFKIVYVGILQDHRLLKEIGEKIIQYPNIELHIGGFGKLQEYFLDLSKKYKNIFYYGQMKYDEVLPFENKGDVMFATYDPKIPNHRYSAPNKLYEAMLLGKPIIVCNNTGVDKIVREKHIGYTINYDAKEFFEAINELILDEKQRTILGNNAKKVYEKEYSWNKMKERLIDSYKKLTDTKEK